MDTLIALVGRSDERATAAVRKMRSEFQGRLLVLAEMAMEQNWVQWPAHQEVTVEKYAQLFRPTDQDFDGKTEIVEINENLFTQNLRKQIQNCHEPMMAEFIMATRELDVVPIEDTIAGFKNTIKNIRDLYTNPDFRSLGQKFSNIPAVVLGAGPSLDKHWNFLRNVQDKAFIIAPDTLTKSMSKKKLSPQLITSVERDHEITLLLNDENDHSDSLLVASAVLMRETIDSYRGPKSFLLQRYGYNNWLPFKKIVLPYGHSCVGLSIMLASLMGFNPIYLVGVDLCFAEDGAPHFEDVPYKHNEKYKNSSFAKFQQAFEKKTNKGEWRKSQIFWHLFQREFEKMISCSRANFFNLSENGAVIAGAEFIPEAVAEEKIAKSSSKPFKEILKAGLQYDRHNEALEELQEFVKKAESLLKSQVFTVGDEAQQFMLQSSPEFETLWNPLFNFSLKKGMTVKNLPELLKGIFNSVKEAREIALQLIKDAQTQKVKLF